MSWWNPTTWAQKQSSEITLDQLIADLAQLQNTAAGVMVNPDTALKAPTVFAIVNVMSRAIASLPFRIEQDQTKDRKRSVVALTDHPIHSLLSRRPNSWQTSYEYWSLVMVRLLLYGEFYAWKRHTRDGRVFDLVPLLPSNVTTVQSRNSGIVFNVVTPSGDHRTLTQRQIHRVVALSTDGIRGTSPIQKCANTIALEIAAEEFGSKLFGSGAMPTGIIERPGHFKDEEALERFKTMWNAAFQKKRGTAVLEEGWKFNPVQMSNEESQFLETRKHQRTVIAGAYGIPPHKVGDLERATFSNIEEMALDFVMSAMRPYLTCIEAAIARDFLTDEEQDDKIRPRFMTNDMLRGDIKTRTDALKIQRENGIISANEWRAIEGMDAREDGGGDDYITPLNFRVEDGDGDDDDIGKVTVVAMRRIK